MYGKISGYSCLGNCLWATLGCDGGVDFAARVARVRLIGLEMRLGCDSAVRVSRCGVGEGGGDAGAMVDRVDR